MKLELDLRLNKRIAALSCACFMIFLISILPARTVFALLMPDAVQGFGVDGSIWKGSARIINVGGQQLRNTEWDIAISHLLIGRIGGEFKTRWGGGFAEGSGSLSFSGTMRLSNVQTAFDASILQPMLGIPALGGQVSLTIDELQLIDNWPRRLIGQGDIRNLSSPLMGRGAADLIGNVSIVFDTATETEVETITGRITDAGGPLEIKGELLLTPPGNYDVDTRIKTRPGAPKDLVNNLRFLGSPEADGNYVFKIAGSI